MEDKQSLWEAVGNQCLSMALALLKADATPTASTVEAVKALVDTAISIDMLNLHWANQTRYGAAGRSGRPFQQK